MEAGRIKNLLSFLGELLPKWLKIFVIVLVLVYVGLFWALSNFTSVQPNLNYQQPNQLPPITDQQPTTSNQQLTTNSAPSVELANSIIIPSLDIAAPLTLVNSTNPDDFNQPLKQGVVWYPSALPGQKGRAVILGHSAPAGFPKINYDWVFSKIHELPKGSAVQVVHDKKQYTYRVTGSEIVKPGQDLAPAANDAAQLALISCWPPGIDNKRIVVYGELVGD